MEMTKLRFANAGNELYFTYEGSQYKIEIFDSGFTNKRLKLYKLEKLFFVFKKYNFIYMNYETKPIPYVDSQDVSERLVWFKDFFEDYLDDEENLKQWENFNEE